VGNGLCRSQLVKDVSVAIDWTSLPLVISSCQPTYLGKTTPPLHVWDIGQYLWEIKSGTCKPLEFSQSLLERARVWLSQTVERVVNGHRKMTLSGKCKVTPTVALNLLPGELVEIKNKEEILFTLDSEGRNRGLVFTPEMLKYCGKRYRILKRLDKMINEQTGKMRQIANTVILERVTCDGEAHGGCQRCCYCLWREIWLKRVE